MTENSQKYKKYTEKVLTNHLKCNTIKTTKEERKQNKKSSFVK